MSEAIRLAERAAQEDEVPVGALLLRNDRIVGVGWNRTESTNDPTGHAEIIALRRASACLGNHRVGGATLVCTLEPCLMCLGAILEARVSRVIYGAEDPVRGAAFLCRSQVLKHMPFGDLEWVGGVLREQCGELLRAFFRDKRGRGAEILP